MTFTNGLKPILRFKGFTNDWQQKRLDAMTVYKNGHGYEDKQVANGLYELINLNSVSIDGGLKSSGKFINETKDTLKTNDLVMVLSDVGHGDLLGRVAIIPKDNKYVLNQRVALLRPFETQNARFLFARINASQAYFKMSGAGSSQLNISKAAVESFSPFVPYDNTEQQKIGIFFSNLDELISFNQQKLDKLTKVKKALLQKMFPANGANVPEIRFKGFIDNWEQHNLGEYVNITTGKLDANAMVPDGKYDFYTSGIQKYKIDIPAFKGPAITIAGNGATVGYMHFADGEFNAYQRTYVLTEFKINREYLYFQIGQKLPKKIASEARTGSIPYIVLDMLTDLKIFKPTETECEKLGSFFSKIDNLIDFHKYKLEKLKNLKKACLDDMFV